MTASKTLAHAAIKDLEAALVKVKRMLPNMELVEWEIVKPIESLEGWLGRNAVDMLQEELGLSESY